MKHKERQEAVIKAKKHLDQVEVETKLSQIREKEIRLVIAWILFRLKILPTRKTFWAALQQLKQNGSP